MLLDMMRDMQGAFKFAGVRVCQRAFIKLTGISSGVIQSMRTDISRGRVSVMKDNMSWMSIKNQSKANRYLDARAWLEVYGELHGEKSPMSLQIFLPAGRKFFYHSQYEFERSLS